MSPLLAWTHDQILAHRSGYHVLADYLDGTQITAPRNDPTGGIALLQTRLLRRFSFSRWCVGGSFDMETMVRQRLRTRERGAVHLLWCDRDLGFLDLLLDPSAHPLIGTFHNCPDDLAAVIRRPSALRKFAAIILMSESQRAYFTSRGIASSKLHRILHGVDVDYFTPLSNEPPESFNVLAVGGTRRNFSLMREVASALKDERQIHFTIIGPADRHHHFSGLANVTCHHRVSDEALLYHFHRASCFLHLPEAATANNAMLEALACGAPVVSQRIGGVPEYVDDDCALLSDASDPAGVVAAIQKLAASRTLQQEMRFAARAHALTLDWRHVARLTSEVYHSLS